MTPENGLRVPVNLEFIYKYNLCPIYLKFCKKTYSGGGGDQLRPFKNRNLVY